MLPGGFPILQNGVYFTGVELESVLASGRRRLVDTGVLTELQLAMLRVIWDKGGATVPEVTRALAAERGLAQSTVATVLTRLEKRGVLRREGVVREYVYRANLSEAQVRKEMVKGLTALLFKGEATALVSHLVQTSEIEEEDLQYAINLIRSAEQKPEKIGPEESE